MIECTCVVRLGGIQPIVAFAWLEPAVVVRLVNASSIIDYRITVPLLLVRLMTIARVDEAAGVGFWFGASTSLSLRLPLIQTQWLLV